MKHILLSLGLIVLPAPIVLGAESEEVKRLVATIRDPDKGHQSKLDAVLKLGERGPEAISALPDMLQFLRTSQVESSKVYSLQAIAGLGKGAVPTLIEFVADEKLNATAIDCLGRLGAEASQASDTLLAAIAADYMRPLRSEHWGYSRMQRAIRTLPKIKGDASKAVPLLVRILASPEFAQESAETPRLTGAWTSVAEDVIKTLGNFGPDSKKAVPNLASVIQSCVTDRVRGGDYLPELAVVTLGQIGPDAKEALPLLRACLADVKITQRIGERELEVAIAKIKGERK